MPAKPKYTRKQSRSKNFVAIPINGTFSLLTLNTDVLLGTDVFPGVLTEDFYAMSVDINSQIVALTTGEGDPLMAGFAHGDYSDAEVEENLEVSFLGPGDKVAQERARRLVRKTGMFSPTSEAATQMKLFGKEGSGQVRTKLRFVINSGKNLRFWVLNKSGANLTTGASLRFTGTVYGRWIL